MKNRIPLLTIITLLSLVFPLTVFADVISGPELVLYRLTQVSPTAIIIMVAVLVIVTTTLIRKLRKR